MLQSQLGTAERVQEKKKNAMGIDAENKERLNRPSHVKYYSIEK